MGYRSEPTYASRLRLEMARKRLTLRQLSQATNFSYEHIRKVAAGHPLLSRACNAAICNAVGLDEVEFWQLAVAEKQSQRMASLGVQGPVGDEERGLLATLRQLTGGERLRLRRIADGWLAAKESATP